MDRQSLSTEALVLARRASLPSEIRGCIALIITEIHVHSRKLTVP